MSHFFALAAWLCTTLGLSLLVCSPAFVPDSLALADDGSTCGYCDYVWNGREWTTSDPAKHCTGQCSCQDPSWLPPGTTIGESMRADCGPADPTVGVDSCIGCNQVCAVGIPPVPGPCVSGFPYVPPCFSWCKCKTGLYGVYSCYPPFI